MTISISDFRRRHTIRTLPPGWENDWALTRRLEITCPSRESWPGTEKVSAEPRPSKRTSTATSWPSRVSLATEVRVVSRRRKRSEEHTSELQSPDHLVCRLLLEK